MAKRGFPKPPTAKPRPVKPFGVSVTTQPGSKSGAMKSGTLVSGSKGTTGHK